MRTQTMRTQTMRRGALLVLLLCAGYLGAARRSAPVRAAAPPSARGLSRALALIPTTAREVDVTDWTLLKAYEGAPALTSASPAAARHRFFTALTRDQATPANCSSQEDERNAASWSWDATDLSWEASSVFPDGAPACVLAFRPGFALAPVIAHFVRRGFHESLYHGVPIYTLPLRDASGAPWFSARRQGHARFVAVAARDARGPRRRRRPGGADAQ